MPSPRQTPARQPSNDVKATAPSLALFHRPTGLAVGLAPKERRYEAHSTRLNSIRPREPKTPQSVRNPRTGSPVPAGAASGIRQACKIAAEHKPAFRRLTGGGLAGAR